MPGYQVSLDRIHITTYYRIPPGESVDISGSAPMHMRIGYSQAVNMPGMCRGTIHAPRDQTVYLLPRLEPAFSRGFAKLPEEIKYMVLAKNVTFEGTFGDVRAPQKPLLAPSQMLHRRIDEKNRSGPAHVLLTHVCSRHDDISRIARQAYLELNTFVITRVSLGSHKLPSALHRAHMRSLKLQLDPIIENWTFMCELCDGRLGFEQLRRLVIEFHWREAYAGLKLLADFLKLLRNAELPGLHFAGIVGEVRFVGSPFWANWPSSGHNDPLYWQLHVPYIEQRVRGLITFGG